MKVNLELIPKNLDAVAKNVQDKVGSVSVSASGAGGAAIGLAAVTGSLLIISEGIKRVVGLLEKSSPHLKGILDIFGRSMQLFFRPFGNALATTLRPLAFILIKAAVKWIQFFEGRFLSEEGKAAQKGLEAAGQGPIQSMINANLAQVVTDIADGLKGIDFVGIGETTIEGLKLFGEDIKTFGKIALEGFELFGQDIMKFGKIALDILINAWDISVEVLENIGQWLWDQITNIIETSIDLMDDFGTWLWDQITGIWNWTFDFAGWLWDQVTSIFDFGGGGAGSNTANTGNRNPSLSEAPGFTGPQPFGGLTIKNDITINESNDPFETQDKIRRGTELGIRRFTST